MDMGKTKKAVSQKTALRSAWPRPRYCTEWMNECISIKAMRKDFTMGAKIRGWPEKDT